MKADYCVVVWAVNLSEQTLVDLSLRHFDLTNDPLLCNNNSMGRVCIAAALDVHSCIIVDSL